MTNAVHMQYTTSISLVLMEEMMIKTKSVTLLPILCDSFPGFFRCKASLFFKYHRCIQYLQESLQAICVKVSPLHNVLLRRIKKVGVVLTVSLNNKSAVTINCVQLLRLVKATHFCVSM